MAALDTVNAEDHLDQVLKASRTRFGRLNIGYEVINALFEHPGTRRITRSVGLRDKLELHQENRDFAAFEQELRRLAA